MPAITKGRPRKTRVTLATLDAPEIRLLRAQASGFDIIDVDTPGSTKVRYRKMESVFDQALRRKWISSDLHRAGELMAMHFQKSGLLPRITMNWSQVIDGSREGGGSDPRERHARKFRDAMLVMPVKYRDGFFGWFIRAQSEDVTVGDLGMLFSKIRDLQGRKSVGILVLEECLTAAARVYGL